MGSPRLLYVDAHDSFAQNIVAQLEQTLGADVTVVTIDDPKVNQFSSEDLAFYLGQNFEGIVIGPGPGSPTRAEDVGFIPRIWHLNEEDLVPVLGICLGFQSMCLAFGGHISRLKEPRHGTVTTITAKPGSVLNRCTSRTANFRVTNYHSLRVQLESSKAKEPWAVSGSIEPLAWDFGDEQNGPVLEAVQHVNKPFWGFQFHPESICTEGGNSMVLQWWDAATDWLRRCGSDQLNVEQRVVKVSRHNRLPVQLDMASNSRAAAREDFKSLSLELGDEVRARSFSAGHLRVRQICDFLNIANSEAILLESGTGPNGAMLYPHTGRHSILGVLTEDTAKLIYDLSSKTMSILRSSHQKPCLRTRPLSDVWSYLEEWMEQMAMSGGCSASPFWGGLMGYISYETGLDTALNLRTDSTTGHVPANAALGLRPDMAYAVVTRSIVVDHQSNTIFVQSVLEEDSWLDETAIALEKLVNQSPGVQEKFTWWPPHPTKPSRSMHARDWARALSMPHHPFSKVRTAAEEYVLKHLQGDHGSKVNVDPCPKQTEYCSKVSLCDEEIRAGNSYELCLTNSIGINIAEAPAELGYPWLLYQRLMRQNSAPFAVYMRMQTDKNEINILGSSPERFLSWNRDAVCEFRPIKGTVKKSAAITLKQATEILLSSKEMAENLMIVDLIRHDLNSVDGVKDVQVPQLFGIEEYMAVYQLVSVIRGRLATSKVPNVQRRRVSCTQPSTKMMSAKGTRPLSRRRNSAVRTGRRDLLTERTRIDTAANKAAAAGISVLRSSLPPGSMTGAPKLRSCQILQGLERQPRGIYSGVIGYLDVGGGGDFSVVIRTAYRWADDKTPDGKDIWTIGAGGAVTAQSTPKGEYDEMLVKANTVLKAFGVGLE